MTCFKKGQKVVSLVDNQGLVKGQTYTVTDTESVATPFGVFVTYMLDSSLTVGNGHLVLDEVRFSRPDLIQRKGFRNRR